MFYKILADFLDAWFHQDFDIEGGSVADVVRAFLRVTPLEEQKGLRAEILDFISAHPNDLDAAFQTEFRPDVIPSVLSGSTRAFLQEILALLGPTGES